MTIIAAMTEDRVIGQDNKMPWKIKAESAHFFRTTRKGTLVMGRKTFESIGSKPLPYRPHVVVSRTMAPIEGVDICPSLDQALSQARTYDREVFVMGGGQIYEQALPLADRMILSYVKGDYPGDTHFPEFDEADWDIDHEDDQPEYRCVEYLRKTD